MGKLQDQLKKMAAGNEEDIISALSQMATDAKTARNAREEIIATALLSLSENISKVPELLQQLLDKETLEINQEKVEFPKIMSVEVVNPPEAAQVEFQLPDLANILRMLLPNRYPVSLDNTPDKPLYIAWVDEEGHVVNPAKLYAPQPVQIPAQVISQPEGRKMFKHGGQGPAEAHGEVPAGVVDGINTVFTLAATPVAGTLKLYLNGVRMKLTEDYTLSGPNITFIVAPTLRGDGSYSPMLADYRKQ